METKPILPSSSGNVKSVSDSIVNFPTKATTESAITEAERQAAREQAQLLFNFQMPESDFERIREGIVGIVEAAMNKNPIHRYEPHESAQAQAAADYLTGFVRYSDGTGWVLYDIDEGRFTAKYGDAVVVAVVDRLAKERWDLRRYLDGNSNHDAAEVLTFARSAITKRGITNVVELLKRENGVFCHATDFDSNPYLLNCMGTTVDLRTGKCMPSLPGHLHMKTTSCQHATDGKTPERWSEFIADITKGRVELAEFLSRLGGYCLTADTKEECFYNFYGSGLNGKGTFIHALQDIMGDYATELPLNAVVLGMNEHESRFGLAGLPGKRLAVVADVGKGKKLAEETVKKLTGGDMMYTEQKYLKGYEFKPIAKLILASNDEIALKDTGTSMRRRFMLVPFDLKLTQEQKNPHLREELQAEAPQILALFIEEAARYLKEGFPPCPIITNASKEYIDGQDMVQQFLDDATEQGNGIGAGELYMGYKTWCDTSGLKPKTQTWFGSELKKKGIEKNRKTAGQWYDGIGLKKPD